MRRWTLPALVVALLPLAVAVGTASGSSGGSPTGTPPLSFGHAGWSWFADPRAVYAGGRVFVGWVDWKRNIMVASIGPGGTTRARIGGEDDPATGRTLGPGRHDDHGNPALLVEADGRITAFYSGHGGPVMHSRTTLLPGDIGSWGPDRYVKPNVPGPAGYSYPNPVRLAAENRTYLIWRGATSEPTFSTRGADGRWSPARVLIDEPGLRPYLKVASNGRDTIDFAFTNGHPKDVVTNIYFAAYRNGALYRANGTSITSLAGLPIRASQADEVYDAWIWDVAMAPNGAPVLVYAVFKQKARRHFYRYARWDGKHWQNHSLAGGGGSISPKHERFYSGGVTLDHRDPRIVYASVGVGRYHEIAKLVTHDGGAHWKRTWITRGSRTDNIRPVVPLGLPAKAQGLFWLHGFYNIWADFRTALVGQR